MRASTQPPGHRFTGSPQRISVDLYFAYGSNLLSSRLRGRVPSATPRGPARLPGYRLAFDKRGRDGSAKANVRREPGQEVWGVLYALDPGHWPALDACEGGYARVPVRVQVGSGERVACATYEARRLTADPVPFEWYRQLILDGAREHGLPAAWLAALERIPGR